MSLSTDERLKAVLGELCPGDKVADVGCDHGKISNLAVQITVNDVFAIDISAASLKKTKDLSRELCQEERVVCLLGDGLFPVDNADVDTAVIAGLGAHEIVRILASARKRYRKYVLVPHRHPDVLRRYLSDNSYGVNKDFIIKCGGKFYPVIVACGEGNVKYTSFELAFGKTRNEAMNEYMAERKKTLTAIIGKANGESLEKAEEELREIDKYENKRNNC